MRNFTNPPKKTNLPQAQIDYDDAIDKHKILLWRSVTMYDPILTFTGYKQAFDERPKLSEIPVPESLWQIIMNEEANFTHAHFTHNWNNYHIGHQLAYQFWMTNVSPFPHLTTCVTTSSVNSLFWILIFLIIPVLSPLIGD